MKPPSDLPDKMSLDNENIKNTVIKMQKFITSRDMRILKNIDERKYLAKCEEKFGKFKFTLPGLYKMVLKQGKNFEMERLEQMLSMKNDVDNKKTSYDDASKKVGLKYYNDFIDKSGKK